LRVLRLKASVYNVYITNQSQTTFVRGGGGGYSKEENSPHFCPNYVYEFGLCTYIQIERMHLVIGMAPIALL
jgi:hypothetical protein